ncbi:MAG: Crp/Fnr family transcriptional regulator [Elusimicrobiales bacterium]|nr:Crp/Fnr family transcriptional regulator [Elusimicrobiales bacterium]
MPIVDCRRCIINDYCIFSKIKLESTKKRWNELKRICFHKKGDIIFQEGEIPKSFFILCNGKIKIYKTSSNGNQMIINIRTPGSIFGYSCLCRNDIYTTSAKVSENSTIAIFPKEFWIDLLKRDFDFSIEIMKLMCSEIGYLQMRLAQIAYQTADEKVASVLINHIRFTTNTNKEPEIYGLKRSDIAEICGLRIETVVRTLQKFEEKKVIKRIGSNIKIINLQELIKINGINN